MLTKSSEMATKENANAQKCKTLQKNSEKFHNRLPLRAIRRRLSLGSTKPASKGLDSSLQQNANGNVTDSKPSQYKSKIRRAQSSLRIQRAENGSILLEDPPAEGREQWRSIVDSSLRQLAPLCTSVCASCKGYLRSRCRCKRSSSSLLTLGNSSENYDSLVKDLSRLSELCKSQPPAKDEKRDVAPINIHNPDDENNVCVVSESQTEPNSPDSGVYSSHSTESIGCVTSRSVSKIVTSPTRDDTLDKEASFYQEKELTVEQDSVLSCRTNLNRTEDFNTFCDLETSGFLSASMTAATDKRRSCNFDQSSNQVESKFQKKGKGKFRRLAKEQVKMWSSQRRHTIETDEHEKRRQSLIRLTPSGRISLRQKYAGKRLSFFGSTTESLMALMQQPEMLQAFRAFLKSEYSEENLDFWLDCQDYRQQKPNRRKKAAARIYATYLDSQAPKEVNIDAETRAKTEQQLGSPTENTFVEAQKHIFDLMESDSFRRFISSDKHF